jgi:hypothetical protein
MADAGRQRFWRVFPWDPAAEPGAPFSPEFVIPPGRQTKGRFDLGTTPVLYLAESPEHAIAELLRPFAGRALRPTQLVGAGHSLALVEVELEPAVFTRLVDLTDPAVLLKYGVRPDVLASRSRAATQSVSRSLSDHGLSGFRWWSALHGDWHALLLFLARIAPGEIAYAPPEHLTPAHPAVVAAARELKME